MEYDVRISELEQEEDGDLGPWSKSICTITEKSAPLYIDTAFSSSPVYRLPGITRRPPVASRQRLLEAARGVVSLSHTAE